MTRALLLGRFQPPHRGHLHAIADAARRHEQVLVGIGSAQHSHSLDDPLTVGERAELLTAAHAARRLRNVHLFPVPDLHRHASWVEHVESVLPSFGVVLTSNPLTRRLFGAAGYTVRPVAALKPEEYRGRNVRRRWAMGGSIRDLVAPEVERGLGRLRIEERYRGIQEATRARTRTH